MLLPIVEKHCRGRNLRGGTAGRVPSQLGWTRGALALLGHWEGWKGYGGSSVSG